MKTVNANTAVNRNVDVGLKLAIPFPILLNIGNCDWSLGGIIIEKTGKKAMTL